MKEIYTGYMCIKCKKEFVLITEELEEHCDRNKYIICPYCSSIKVKKENKADSLREVMKARSYKRVNGALHQK